jgi:hypothetical protein
VDDLDRIFHRLVSNIRHRHSEYLTLPFTVQELYETLIPYRHHRRELGIETNQDYEIAMTRLLSGERDYLLTDQSMRDKLRSELDQPNMDPGAFREFATSKVSLAPEALRRIRALTATDEGQGESAAPKPVAASWSAPLAPSPTPAPPPAEQAPSAEQAHVPFSVPAPAASPPAAAPAIPAAPASFTVPEGCRFCGGTLPEGRNVIYCPHCGNNLSVSRCPACGSELEKGWKFCTTCGRAVGT